ncbi:MAG: aminotransferase class V-fold PLP-dependent enzyme [Candidatus Kapaibacterium sp.]
MSLEEYFAPYRKNIIGIDAEFESATGRRRVIYADWTASGRMYRPIEERMLSMVAPYVANTHTETSFCGTTMTRAYAEAMRTIRRHVNAAESDAVICYGSGMTAVVNKLQRMLGLRIHERFRPSITIPESERPVVFITHMEHHSNQTSWLETIAEVRIISSTDDGLVDLNSLRILLDEYPERPLKIAAITSCSNVTGIMTPYHDIAEIMHEAGGYCFVDFACSAPYIGIDMHPTGRPLASLDAIYFSPHKFLGGPGTSGVLVFNSALYSSSVPDNPGGGTVAFTNPWGVHQYLDDIEAREDGGTPGFLQVMRTALCMRLKEQMGVENILAREHEIMQILWDGLESITGVELLAEQHRRRLGIIPLCFDNVHYNLAVRVLNDRFGIQVRGGCSCAGTYGHYLLNISPDDSHTILCEIVSGNVQTRPGWVRISIHPTMSNDEAHEIVRAVRWVAENHEECNSTYRAIGDTNEYELVESAPCESIDVAAWFAAI